MGLSELLVGIRLLGPNHGLNQTSPDVFNAEKLWAHATFYLNLVFNRKKFVLSCIFILSR